VILDQKQLLEYLAEQLEGCAGDTLANIANMVTDHKVEYLGDGVWELKNGVPEGEEVKNPYR
jgi:hypothetical protein